MNTIVLTSNNIQGSGNNNFVYKFPNSKTFINKEIGLSSLDIYYSWYNISSALGNNRFTYTWVVGTTTTTYTVIIPDGLWEISTINSYLQSIFISNNHYLINSSGNFVYYAEFLVNPSLYVVNINTYPFPTSLPSGWSQPSGFAGYPIQTFNPLITIPSAFNLIVGYAVNFATSQNTGIGTTLSYSSSLVPQVQPNPTILVTATNIDNIYSTPSGVLYSITPDVGIGELYSDKPPEIIFQPIINGTYNEIRIQLVKTSDFSPIQIIDPNTVIILVIRDRQEKSKTNF